MCGMYEDDNMTRYHRSAQDEETVYPTPDYTEPIPKVGPPDSVDMVRKMLRESVNSSGLRMTDDMSEIVTQMSTILKTFATQNVKYGDSWKNDGLGPRSLFAESNAKHHRLKQLLWDTPPEDWDVAKIVETLRDRALYDLLTIVKIKLECGIDENAVQKEVDKT